jgi:hypothetical protein
MTQTSSPQSDLVQPELAFEAMAQRLAGLTAAMDGFAARQQELHGRDYGPDLEKIQASFERVRVVINDLAAKPALTMTPEAFAERIEKAARGGRQADHDAWDRAQGRLEGAARSVEAVVASAWQARVQRYWIAGTAAASLVLGMVLAYGCAGAIDRLVPENWHWPEASAARMLRRSEWDAGVRLMQVADPQEWQQVARATAILREMLKASRTAMPMLRR